MCIQHWPFTIPMPGKIEVHTVPLFQAPINAKVKPCQSAEERSWNEYMHE